jgi:hypothetical protein
VSKLYPWLSILMALALAVVEWAFFFEAANWTASRGRSRRIGWASIWRGLRSSIFPSSFSQ